MIRTLAAAALACSALGCGQSNAVTPAGTVLAEWDSTKASRAPFAKATIGARTSKDVKVRAAPKDTPPFELVVHVETASVDFVEDGKDVHQQAPVAIKIAVKDNTGWELSGKCLDGPNYKMPSVGPGGELVTPLGMSQDCQISQHRRAGLIFKSEWHVGFSLIFHGDGTIKAFPAQDVTIE